MTEALPPAPMIPPKIVIRCSLLIVASSLLFGIIVLHKATDLPFLPVYGEMLPPIKATSVRAPSVSPQPAPPAEADTQVASLEARIEKAEIALAEAQTKSTELEAKAQSGEATIAQMQEKITAAETKAANHATEFAAVDQLKTQLVETRKQLDAAERENALLSGKLEKLVEEPAAKTKKRHPRGGGDPGIQGRVLAVNRDYNFVVLNLGARQGVEPNAEMLVVRRGSFIGKIRVSTVEPSTTIGDIIASSLARGVQVQPGDIVVYGGTNF